MTVRREFCRLPQDKDLVARLIPTIADHLDLGWCYSCSYMRLSIFCTVSQWSLCTLLYRWLVTLVAAHHYNELPIWLCILLQEYKRKTVLILVLDIVLISEKSPLCFSDIFLIVLVVSLVPTTRR